MSITGSFLTITVEKPQLSSYNGKIIRLKNKYTNNKKTTE